MRNAATHTKRHDKSRTAAPIDSAVEPSPAAISAAVIAMAAAIDAAIAALARRRDRWKATAEPSIPPVPDLRLPNAEAQRLEQKYTVSPPTAREAAASAGSIVVPHTGSTASILVTLRTSGAPRIRASY